MPGGTSACGREQTRGGVYHSAMSSTQAVLDKALSELVNVHHAHTILLYGSRANGTHATDSDYDIAAFARCEKGIRIARETPDGFLDAFVYPDTALSAAVPEHFKLLGGRLLLDRDGRAAEFLRRVEEVHRRGPEALSADEVQMRVVWAHKMVARASRRDPEGDFRRAWLLTALIEDHFAINGRWYEGPKKALAWLQANDAALYEAYVAALRPNASSAQLRVLVDTAYGSMPA